VVCASAPSPIRVLPRFSFVGCSARVPRSGLGASTSMSERELERVYAGLLKLAALPDEELRALVASLLADTQDA
jgi:hypothetical protein